MQNDNSMTGFLKDVLNYYKKKSDAKISVFTEKNKKYEDFIFQYNKYYQDHKQSISNDFFSALNDYRNNSSKIITIQGMEYEFDNPSSNIIVHLFIDIHVFFRLYKMKHYTEKPLNNIDDIISYDNRDGIVWYRGQTNTNWQLVPSFFRNARESFLWTWSDIYNDYNSKPNKVSLIKKLNEVDINTAAFPYKTAAFIQHSIGYSPLIDFTRSPEVAI